MEGDFFERFILFVIKVIMSAIILVGLFLSFGTFFASVWVGIKDLFS